MELACLKYFQPGFDSNNPLPFGLTFELKITHRPDRTHKFVSSVCCVYCINRVVLAGTCSDITLFFWALHLTSKHPSDWLEIIGLFHQLVVILYCTNIFVS